MFRLNPFVGMCAAVGMLASTTARSSEGPWTTPKGLHNFYTGLYFERFQCFTLDGVNDAECGENAAAIPAPVQRVGAKLFYRTGLTRNVDVAGSLPVLRAFSSEEGNTDLAPTTGVGTLQTRVRWKMGDLGPIQVASGAGLETGVLHRSTRGRITNLGDGVTSAVGTVYAGATGLVGRRFYTVSTDASYVFRFPELDSDVGRLPADEVRFSSVLLYALNARVGIGASVDGQMRLWGEPLEFAQLATYGGDDDSPRWAVLDASQIKVGGRIALYPTENRPYLQAAVHRSVWAVHNPIDTTIVELAAGFDLGERK